MLTDEQKKKTGRLPWIKTACPHCGAKLRSGSSRVFITWYYCTARCGYSLKLPRPINQEKPEGKQDGS